MNDLFCVIGGNAAGLSAAMQIKRLSPKTHVILFEKSGLVSYSKCLLPYYLSGRIEGIDAISVKPAVFFSDQGIEILQAEVTRIDVRSREVLYIENGRLRTLRYRKLLLATGTRYSKPEGENFFMPVPDDYIRAGELIRAGKIRTAAVIGGGFAGCETALELSRVGIAVDLIEKNRVLSLFSPQFAEELKGFLGGNTRMMENTDFLGTDGELLRTSRFERKYDAAFFCLTPKPSTEMIDIPKMKNGAVRTDAKCRTENEDIFAAGDCASVTFVNNRTGTMPSAVYANKTGKTAAYSMLSKRTPGFFASGSTMIDLDGIVAARTGVEEGSVCIVKKLPDSKDDKGRPSGGLIVLGCSESGIIKYGEVFSPGTYALQAVTLLGSFLGRPLNELIAADIPYAPFINRVLDPVQAAAFGLLLKIR